MKQILIADILPQQKIISITDHQQFQLDHLIKPAENIKIRTTAYKNNFHRNWYKLNDVTITDKESISNILASPEDYPLEYDAIESMNDTGQDVFGVKANNRSYESKGIQSVANITFGKQTFNDIEIGFRYHEDYEDRFQWVDKYGDSKSRNDQNHCSKKRK